MKPSDVNQVRILLNKYLSQFLVKQNWSKKEVTHFLLPREKVMYSYVVEAPVDKKIIGFFSFYSLPSSVLKHETHKTLWAAYSYYFATDKDNNGPSMKDLINSALIIAKNQEFDVFNS